ncbi:hypothetical protein GYMLUDRAFT_176075 [Collybiopsis luxurians FD-317 M1]|uniref:Arrestin-like N-terminal domain-containing protein n=1 Tax=Collybiopsis luxurians FD-317 M1 TaxID=944289 RepID=A0A0D0BZ33_9AGAR|nr:hypothetical protein GYMLUDRAFT_176075 [Collybiopsis luxurians FD-317 M1]
MESSLNAFIYGNGSSVPQSVTSLPAYSPPPQRPRTSRRELTEHVVELSSNRSDKNAKPWATLRVYSKGPEGALPMFVEGEKITGSVALDSSMSNSRHISCVKVIVRGELSTGIREVDRVTFLETSTTLWSKNSREDTQPLHWQFSLDIPREVITTSGTLNKIDSYLLPPTFIERNTRACVRYNLIVFISRSKFREDSNLQTTFVYIPATRPDPPSPLRQLAYQEHSSLPGPEADPNGWYTLPAAKVYGKLFSNRVVEVTCRLSLAKPLSYTRGTVIPLSLTLISTDSQALDLLSSPQAVVVKLRRTVTSNHAANFAEYNAPWIMGSSTDSVDDLHSAVWWKRPGDNVPNDETNTTSGSRLCRELEGEIVLSKNLKPTFRISHFGTEYSIVMLPFKSTGFVPSTPAQKFNNGPILTVPVEIATMFAKGPRPIAHSPPEYQRSSRPNTSRSSNLPPSRASLPSRGR